MEGEKEAARVHEEDPEQRARERAVVAAAASVLKVPGLGDGPQRPKHDFCDPFSEPKAEYLEENAVPCRSRAAC